MVSKTRSGGVRGAGWWLVLGLAVLAVAAPGVRALELGDSAPPLQVAQWVKGEAVEIASGQGANAYVVEFWATWCPPCRASIPHLTEIQKRYEDKGLVVIGVSSEGAAKVEAFVAEQGEKMDYRVALDDARKTSQAYMRPFNVRGIPHAFLVDRNGALAWHGHPMSPALEKEIEKALAGDAGGGGDPAAGGVAAGEGRLELGGEAPELAVGEWVKGEPVSLAAPGRNITVVEFWATWCPPCRVTIPHLTEVQKRFADQGVVVVGISSEAAEKVKPFVAEQGDRMAYVVAVDPERAISKAYMEPFGVNGIPYAFIVDRDGRLAWHGHPMAGLEEALEKMVAGDFDVDAAKAAGEARVMMRDYFGMVDREDGAGKAAELGREIVDRGAGDPNLLNEFAWTILTGRRVKARDLPLALRASEAAYNASRGQQPAITDTYARALYDTGSRAEAVRMQQEAVRVAEEQREDAIRDLTQKQRLCEGLRETLKRYQTEE